MTPTRKQTEPTPTDLARLDFHLEKAHASMVEAGRHLTATYLYTALFTVLTAILVLGEGTDSPMSVPILGIALERSYASEATLLLAALAFYAHVSNKSAERLLSFKVDELIAQRFGEEAFHWHLYYPSLYTSSELFGLVSWLGKPASLVPPLVLAVATLGIAALGIKLVNNSGGELHAVAALAGAVMVLSVSWLNLVGTPKASAYRGAYLKKIEQ